MADNVTANPGSGGAVFASDDISSVHYPRTKLTLGADGVNDGDVSSANPLPVKGTGTAGTANSGVVTVQGITSMTPIQVGDNGSSLTVDGTVGVSGTVTVDSELPAAAALADNASNPTAPAVGAFLMEWDGSGWDRGPGNATDGLLVNLGANNDVTLGAALPAGANTIGDVTISGAALTALQLIDDVIVTDDAAFTPASGKVSMVGAMFDDVASDTVDEGDGGALRMSNRRELYVQLRDAAGNERGLNINASGQIAISNTSFAVTNAGTFATQVDGAALTALQLIDDPVVQDDNAFTPGTTKVMMAGFEADETATDSVDEGDGGAARMTLDRKVIVTTQPHTKGGLTQHKTISAASTNATSVKGSAGQVYGVQVFNLNASARYLKLYNKATAPTVGTDTPVKTLLIPGNTAGAGLVLSWANGLEFDTGIAFALTTGIADSDTGAVSANETAVNLDYK